MFSPTSTAMDDTVCNVIIFGGFKATEQSFEGQNMSSCAIHFRASSE